MGWGTILMLLVSSRTIHAFTRCYYSQARQNQTHAELNESDEELQQQIERRMAVIGENIITWIIYSCSYTVWLCLH